MTVLLDWLGRENRRRIRTKTAGTSNVSQNAPAIWRSNRVVHSPPVNVAVAIRQMVMKRLYEDARSEASNVGMHESDSEATSQQAETVRNATARTEIFVCQIRNRSAGWASSNENVLRLVSRPIVVSANDRQAEEKQAGDIEIIGPRDRLNQRQQHSTNPALAAAGGFPF